MNEEELLSQLRDIHVPVALSEAAPVAFAAWPFIVLAVVIAMVLAVRFWRHNQWRQGAKAEFAHILQVEDRAAQWPMLINFAASLSRRAGRVITLPELAYRNPDTISEDERTAFIDTLGAELGR